MAAALQGLKIVDFSRVLAGPFATMLLGDLGAEVLKIERPGAGDDTRAWGPPYDEAGTATYFQAVNRNKRSLVIDLGDEAQRARVRTLVRDADVVVENFRPGLMEEFGLGYEQLRVGNPRLIYCSITGFGAGAGDLPGYDLLVQALGGLMSITGEPDGSPIKVGVALVDVLSGLFATVGILTAAIHRNASGEGQRVDVNLLSSLLAALVNQASAFTSGGVVAGRMGNRHPSIAPYELYRCGEGELIVAVGNDRQFRALSDALGAPGLASDPRYLSNALRVSHQAELAVELEQRLAARPAGEWAALLSEARVPAGEVNDIGGAFALAERLGLDPIIAVPTPEGGEVRLPRNPIGLSLTPPSYRLAPPALTDSPVDEDPVAAQ